MLLRVTLKCQILNSLNDFNNNDRRQRFIDFSKGSRALKRKFPFHYYHLSKYSHLNQIDKTVRTDDFKPHSHQNIQKVKLVL